MPETPTAARPALTVQPREIRETAFRALFSAGAEPAEAQEGAEAVLRLEAETGRGIALLPALVEGDWQAPPAETAPSPALGQDAAAFAHHGNGQPALRTLIQLVDLVIEHADDAGTVIAHTPEVHLPPGLGAALAARASILTGRAAAVAVAEPSGQGAETVTTHQVQGRQKTETSTRTEVAATLAASRIADGGTVVILLPQRQEQTSSVASVPPLPITVDAEEWDAAYRLAGAYLVADR